MSKKGYGEIGSSLHKIGRDDIPEIDCRCGRIIMPKGGEFRVRCSCGRGYILIKDWQALYVEGS